MVDVYGMAEERRFARIAPITNNRTPVDLKKLTKRNVTNSPQVDLAKLRRQNILANSVDTKMKAML